MNFRFLSVLRFGCILILLHSLSYGLRIEITKGSIQKDPIAIVAFNSDQPISASDPATITDIIGSDLESCGLFEWIPPTSYIQTIQALQAQGPALSEWRVLKARFLLYGAVYTENNTVRVQFRLYDIITGQQMVGQELSADRSKMRELAHKIADQVYSRITNEDGYFNSRIVFVTVYNRFTKHAEKRIAIMDRDGHQFKEITSGPLDLTPRFSPTGEKIAFLSFKGKNNPQVYLLDLKSKTPEVLGSFKGMTYAPRFSRDGKRLVFSHIADESSRNSICIMDLQTHQKTILTDSMGIDTSPCFSPDGAQVVFVSDRGGRLGSANLFVMNKDGDNLRQISFGRGRYFQPVWSPRGDLIAFIKRLAGQFYLGVMEPDGSRERLITSAYLIESPAWTPNGRYLIFTKENGPSQKGKLWFIDLTGHNLHPLPVGSKDAVDCDLGIKRED